MASQRPAMVDFDLCPFLVIWETTRSCGLACRHCRASAVLGRDPGELTTQEGFRLLDQTAQMGTPIFILSGGDPLNRPDLEALVAHGKAAGLRMGTIPAATPSLTRERIFGLAAAGLDQVAFSLDGPNAAAHDGFRGVPGAFDKTLEGLAWAREAGLPVQINTCFAAWNFPLLEDMIRLVESQGIVFWEVFFLIPTGRGAAMAGLSPEQFETAFERLHRLSARAPFVVKLTEGQHYRRYAARLGAAPASRPGRGIGASPRAVNAGNGFMFVDHLGQVFPSGFLPLKAGDARRSTLAQIYRGSPLFRELRDPALLKGKCGACEFARVCGGSRARAHAVTGDYLSADPACAYIPQKKTAAA